MAEFLYPGHQFAFLFDWSTCHDKMPAHAFSVTKFKTTPGFQYTKPRDKSKPSEQKEFVVGDLKLECEYPDANVTFTNNIQAVCFGPGEGPHFKRQDQCYDGLPKGLCQLLWERGL